MNESFLLRFESAARPLKVVGFTKEEGVVFDWHRDASPLILAIGLQPLFPALLEPVRQRHDWRDQQFRMDAVEHDGGLRFSGGEGDAEGLPPGVYDLTVEVESMSFRDAARRVIIREGGQTEVTLHEKPDRRAIRLRDNIDPLTARLIDEPRSSIDGEPLRTWLGSPRPRAARQACLLNLLAKLRVPPDPPRGLGEPLTAALKFLYFADVDRAYAAARPEIGPYLEELVSAGLWVKEGYPAVSIHERLRASLARFDMDEATRGGFALTSYRQGGRNCLQIVVASPPEAYASPTCYLDIDMDLGNPLWDLEGLVVHLGEFLDPAKTDHFALRRALDKGATKDFICYDVVRA